MTLHIHIIEDDPGVSDALVTVMAGLGHSVSCYCDGETFLENSPPGQDDVVIVDLSLPGISGSDIVRELKQMSAPPQIIVISGRPKNLLDRTLKEHDPIVVLRKPLSLPTLVEHLP